ncbi:MAG TPA: outer membrane protein assembly factor BamB [Burkholderiaceae bacterium]|nr:outer membrane protein assembly factor BamB [Burkholderiaceae bacterium]
MTYRSGGGPAARTARGAAMLALAAGIGLSAGCSWIPTWLGGTPSKESQAAPLPEFTPSLATRVAWRANVGSARGAFLQPAVLENAIFAASADGNIVRLAPATGEVVWRAEVKSKISGGVGSDGFIVAVGTARGEVLTFGADGKPLWQAQVLGEVQSPPLVGRGLVIVRASDFRVTAFDAETGRRRWTYQRATTPLTLRGPSEMAFSGDQVVAGFPGGRLVALASASGAVRWDVGVSEPRGATEVERLADVMGQPLVMAGDVCAASYQGRLACFEAANGALRWARDLSAMTGPGGDDQRLFVVDAKSHLHAYSRTAGASAWLQKKLEKRELSAPLALRRAVVTGDLLGYVHFLSPEDGAFIGRVELGSAISAPPRAFGGGAVVQTQDGVVALINIE